MRPTRDQINMLHAHVAAKRGTCSRLHVGAVVVRDHRILVTGYNGNPSGMPHCAHDCTCNWAQISSSRQHHASNCAVNNPCLTAVHAEANVIAFAARYGVTLDGTELYTTHAPCLACAMLIINAGIMHVCYGLPYRDDAGLKLLAEAHVEVHWITT